MPAQEPAPAGGQRAPILNPGLSRGHLGLSATAQKVPTRLVPASSWGPRYDPSYQAQPPPLTQSELAAKAAVITPTPPPLPGSRSDVRWAWTLVAGVCGRAYGAGAGTQQARPAASADHSSFCPRPLLSIPQSGAAPWCPWAVASDTPTLWERAWGTDHPSDSRYRPRPPPPPPPPPPPALSGLQWSSTRTTPDSGCRPRLPAPSLLKASPLGCLLTHLSAPVHSPALGIPSSPDPLVPSGHWAPQQQPWSMEGAPALTPVPTCLPSHPISGS